MKSSNYSLCGKQAANYVYGSKLMTQAQKIYYFGIMVGDGVNKNQNSNNQSINFQMMTYGIMEVDNLMTSDGWTSGSGDPFMSTSYLLSDGITVGEWLMVGDTTTWAGTMVSSKFGMSV